MVMPGSAGSAGQWGSGTCQKLCQALQTPLGYAPRSMLSVPRMKDLCCAFINLSPLLDLGAAEGGVDALVHEIPVDLLKHLVDVGGLGAEERALAEGCRLEELDRQAAGAHLSGNPDPALAIIHHLLGLIDTIADAALGHEHGVLHLRLQALHAHLDVLLADGALGRVAAAARDRLGIKRRNVRVADLILAAPR